MCNVASIITNILRKLSLPLLESQLHKARFGDLSDDEIYERQARVERNWHSVE